LEDYRKSNAVAPHVKFQAGAEEEEEGGDGADDATVVPTNSPLNWAAFKVCVSVYECECVCGHLAICCYLCRETCTEW
jgi:hypothetical protein